MTITASSAKVTISTEVKNLWNAETSVARRISTESYPLSFYGMMNSLVATTKALDGLTPSTAEMNKAKGRCTKASVWPTGLFLTPGSYGFYIRIKKQSVTGSYLWGGIGMTHVYSAWATIHSSEPVVGLTGLYPNCPPRVKCMPKITTATQVYVQHLKTGTYGPGSISTFGTALMTHIYALGY